MRVYKKEYKLKVLCLEPGTTRMGGGQWLQLEGCWTFEKSGPGVTRPGVKGKM